MIHTYCKSRYQQALFSSNKGVGDFSVASHWWKRADLTKAGYLRLIEMVPSSAAV
jgi:hypothetical protein